MKIYLAGPEVFLPDAAEVGRRKIDICAEHGLVGLFPLDLDAPAGPAGSPAIFRACLSAMERSDAIVANLTPFRGIGADPGTAFELGYMLALGRPAFGYSNNPAPLVERASAVLGPLRREKDQLVATDGCAVENFELFDNLMLAEALLARGAGVFVPPRPVADPHRDLSTFERCVARAAESLRGVASA